MPTITTWAGRQALQACTVPADYHIFTSFGYNNAAGIERSHQRDVGYLGGSAVTLALLLTPIGRVGHNWPPASAAPATGARRGAAAPSPVRLHRRRGVKFAIVTGTF